MVFMNEGRRLMAGEAILSEAATLVRRQDVRSDDAVVEHLVREHSRFVYRIAYAVLRRHHEAEDATQKTFIRVWRYRSKLAAVEDPKTWPARIAWRVAVDQSKQQGRKREIPLEGPERSFEEFASSDVTADETVQGSQVRTVIDGLIAALPNKLRQSLILSTIEEMSPREAGATLGINEAAVRSRVFRARQILRDKLSAKMSRK
jgi:RNA polymerase sigma-70 factor, ECF subfamily